MARIRVGEAITGLGLSEERWGKLSTPDIVVTPTFLEILQTKPPLFLSEQGAYVFTDSKDVSIVDHGFYHFGRHGVDALQTTLINMNLADEKDFSKMRHHKAWTRLYPDWMWYSKRNCRRKLLQVQKEISPSILFVGNTNCDGVDIYVHKNQQQEIDGILLQPGFQAMLDLLDSVRHNSP